MKAGRFETLVALVIITVPMGGVLFPPETYFAAQDFSIENADKEIGFPFARYTFGMILIWIGWLAFLHQRLMLQAISRCWLPLVFVCWMLATASFTEDPAASLNRGGRTLIVIVFAAYLTERFDTAELLKLLLLAGLIAVIGSVLAVVAIPQFGLTTLMGYEGAWRGVFAHKNALGAAMALLCVEAYFARKAGLLAVKSAVGLGSAALTLLVLSRSGTSVLLLAVMVVTTAVLEFLLRLNDHNQRALVLFSLVALSVPLAILAHSYADQIVALLGRDPTLTGRTELWTTVWQLIRAEPIWGHGNGFWAIDGVLRGQIWADMEWGAPHAHNAYLDIWFQTGIIGLAIFALILAVTMLNIMRLLCYPYGMIELIWPVLILALLVRGISETQFVEPGASAWFIFGLAFASLGKFLQAKSVDRAHPSVLQDFR